MDQIETLVREAQAVDIAVQARNDAQGHGALKPIGAAHGYGPIAHLQGLGVAQTGGAQIPRAGDFDHGQIGNRIGAHHRTVHMATIGQGDLNAVDLIDHVGVSENQALGCIDYDARPLTPLPHAAGGIAE